MKIGLVSYEFKNNDIEFNISQIEKALKNAHSIDLLCFGEAFLQGFDAFSWNYENDKKIAISKDSVLMQRIEKLSKKYSIDLLLGYLEKDEDSLYSSCAVIINGKLQYNYRRISIGWKEYTITDHHYKEGNEVVHFDYKNHHICIALCGDMWEKPENFKCDDILIWPVYTDFSIEEWEDEEAEYAIQANIACKNTLMINSISKNPICHGGAFYFKDGKLKDKFAYDIEAILEVNI